MPMVETRTAAPTVFSCVASRNKRERETREPGSLYPTTSGTAPGYRYSNSGLPGGNGDFGYSNSSAVSTVRNLTLWSHAQGLNPSAEDTRASSFQLRCLSE